MMSSSSPSRRAHANRDTIHAGTGTKPPWYPLLYLLPLALIFDLCGYLPPYLRLYLTYALLGLPLSLRPSKRSALGAGGLLVAMVLEAALTLPPVADLCVLLLAHQWVWAMLGPIPARLTTGLLSYAFLHLYLFLSPLGYPVLEQLATAGSRLAGWVTGSAYTLGYTYQNLGGGLLFLCLSVFGWDRTRASKGRTASFLVVVILLNGFLAAMLIRKVDFGAEFAWKLKYREPFGYAQLWQHVRGLAVLVYPLLAFLAYLGAYLLLHYESWKEPGPTALPKTWRDWLRWFYPASPRQAGLVAGAIGLLLLCVPPTTWRKPLPAELVFVERGVVSFTRPDYQRFGRAAGGMYGLFPEYARLFGCRASVVKDIPNPLLPGQIVILTNLDEPLAPEDQQRLWDFVAAGGKLWVLGDHTFIKNGRNHINDLLAPCHIQLRHDSAQFFPQGWFNSYRFRQGTPFGGLQDPAENRPAILVGASLELKVPAQPFIVGRFGYGDWGVTEPTDKRGYIGDFKYQPTERLGDLVLVAGEKYGQGKVLVFGDTTSFFSNNMSRSYELLRACLSWFGEGSGWTMLGGWPARMVTGLILLGLLLLLLLWRSTALLLPALAAVFVVSLAAHQPKGLLPFLPQFARSHLAVIDFAHQPYASKHSSMNSGLHGVTINLERYGLLPAAMDVWDRDMLDAAGWMILNAPQRPFSRSERRDLNAFMERGGSVVVGCGFANYEHCRSLLEPLGLVVRGLPLGRFFDRTAFGRPISFMSAWPIEVDNPKAAIISLYDNWPLIVEVPVGKGRLVLIGDSEFLHNRNLEGFESHDPSNVQFLKALLDHFREEKRT